MNDGLARISRGKFIPPERIYVRPFTKLEVLQWGEQELRSKYSWELAKEEGINQRLQKLQERLIKDRSRFRARDAVLNKGLRVLSNRFPTEKTRNAAVQSQIHKHRKDLRHNLTELNQKSQNIQAQMKSWRMKGVTVRKNSRLVWSELKRYFV